MDDRLGEVCQRPMPLFDAATQVGDRLGVLPVLFHLLWRQVLRVDLTTELLYSGSLVSAAGHSGGRR